MQSGLAASILSGIPPFHNYVLYSMGNRGTTVIFFFEKR